MVNCISCNSDVLAKKNYVRFNCPNCSKFEIVRCNTCRALGREYICRNCNFKGP